MISLAIETSTDRGFVALFKDNTMIYQKILPFGLQNSKSLFPEIVKGFNEAKLTPADLHLIAVGIGPGSYTGIRVGAMTAKTFAFALKIPLIGICSLSNFIPTVDGYFASMIDAKIGGAYLQTGYMEKGTVKNLSVPKLYQLDEAYRIIKEIPVIVTPNATFLKPKLEKLAGIDSWRWEESNPSIDHMFFSMMSAHEKGEFQSGSTLDLLYLRKTQAEIESNR
jgi:tRNA threonylcarbamoyl adenosine modification protein YeaZ